MELNMNCASYSNIVYLTIQIHVYYNFFLIQYEIPIN